MKTLIVLGIIVLTLVITNPDLATHQAKMQGLLIEEMLVDKKSKKGIRSILKSSLANSMIGNVISIDNYVLFSLTKIKIQEFNKTVGIGILGNVFIFSDKKNIKESSASKEDALDTFQKKIKELSNEKSVQDLLKSP